MDNENNEIENFRSSSSDDDEPALDLDLNALQQLASSRLDRHCVHARRLTKGLYNEIYLLQFEAGPDCIARLSCDLTHPAAKFASEVATMKYVAQNTSIKVPEVYDWDGTVHNPIKIPYILMERIPGQHLYRVWDELTVEKKKCVLSQIVDTLLELWTKCQFEEIGCLYMDFMTSTFRIGPIVDPVFYIRGRNAISSFTGPFRSMQELFDALIQKEKKFFEIHVQELTKKKKINQITKVENLIKLMTSLQSKLFIPFDKSIDQKPFVLVHGDFDAQNILVERDEIKVVGIIDWEFSRTGTLWNLCQYPIWIQEVEEPFRVLNDLELQESREKQKLREFFHGEMVAKLGSRSGQILEMKNRDLRIEKLEDMFTYMVHSFAGLQGLLKSFFYRYGPELTNVHFDDPIIEYFWEIIKYKVQIPSKRVITYLLSKEELLLNRIMEEVPIDYIASVYYELKSNDYNFSWQQASTIAFHMWKNENKDNPQFMNIDL
ncbi:kinase-like domain-containing protein [Rhizophagus clarus]|uniref:Kinase-like domain-containing protein n=1 Tax=Rhizophagus clarus TaxID=94130 RepID=A0A8H3QPS9_9GLOM|nr:kinase-like domain-containing protein [Rhizophagus clarus]